jgi:hypothetical protein
MRGNPFNLPATGDYPWVDADHAYAGWIPNVSGHLSFNLIDPHSREPTYNHQHDLKMPRTVALHRSRLAQDYPFFDWIVRLSRRSAVQEFIVLAETRPVGTPYFSGDKRKEAADTNGVLLGVVAVLPSEADRETRKRRAELLAVVDGAIHEAATEKATCGADPNRRLAREIYAGLDQARPSIACHLLRFALFRTGELRIWFDLSDFLGRDIVADPPTAIERIAADHLAPQVYYCLKDLLHAHYHHDAHSDQLLPLTATETRTSQVAHDASEAAWRYATLRGLARVVVELRQGRSVTGHQRAKGIIAYAQAFQVVLARVRRGRTIGAQHGPEGQIIPYDFDNLAMSLDATDASAQSAISARLQFLAILVGIILSGLALWAGAVQIQPILCTSLATPDACPKIRPGPIVSVVNWISANPLGFMISLVVLGIAAFIVWFNGTNALPWVERSIRWLRKLSEAIGVQISRALRGSDWVGWAASLLILGGLSGFSAWVAFNVAPKTPVPPVILDDDVQNSPWASLYPMVGQRIDQSGLLVRSAIAPELRTLLDDEYAAFVKLFPAESTLTRSGRVLVLTSAGAPGGDGAYLIIDPRNLRLESGLRRDGLLSVHRTVGASLPRPVVVLDLLGTSGRSDAGPIPAETSTCNFVLGGPAGRTLHLSGTLKATEFCEYGVELHAGQAISFDPKQAKGLAVLAIQNGKTVPIGTSFIASAAGKQTIRVVWSGWRPIGSSALKPRAFYVRLLVH